MTKFLLAAFLFLLTGYFLAEQQGLSAPYCFVEQTQEEGEKAEQRGKLQPYEDDVYSAYYHLYALGASLTGVTFFTTHHQLSRGFMNNPEMPPNRG